MVLPPVVGGIALLYAFGRKGFVGPDPLRPDRLAARVHHHGRHRGRGVRRHALPRHHGRSRLPVGGPPLRGGGGHARRRSPGPFRRVTLPPSRPALAAGAALTWARALGEFGATITFAGNTAGRTQTIRSSSTSTSSRATRARPSRSRSCCCRVAARARRAARPLARQAMSLDRVHRLTLGGPRPRCRSRRRTARWSPSSGRTERARPPWCAPWPGSCRSTAAASSSTGGRRGAAPVQAATRAGPSVWASCSKSRGCSPPHRAGERRVRAAGAGTPKAARRTAAGRAWLDRVGLPDVAGRRPKHLSGGQAQRVARRGPSPPSRRSCCSTSRWPRRRRRQADLRRVLRAELDGRGRGSSSPTTRWRPPRWPTGWSPCEGGRITQTGQLAEVTARPLPVDRADGGPQLAGG